MTKHICIILDDIKLSIVLDDEAPRLRPEFQREREKELELENFILQGL